MKKRDSPPQKVGKETSCVERTCPLGSPVFGSLGRTPSETPSRHVHEGHGPYGRKGLVVGVMDMARREDGRV